MRRISDTIARLSAIRGREHMDTLAAAATGRLAKLGDFGANPGNLGARIHVPENVPDNAPLVVVLHGCTQTAEAYDQGAGWSTLADRAGFVVLYPEQNRSNNPNLCFNWFVPAHTTRGRGEAGSIREMIETVCIRHRIDRKRIFITGLSAGGAMTSAMLATYPDLFAGGAIIAGLPYASASTVPEAFDRMRGHLGPTPIDLQRLLRDASSHPGPWPTLSLWHGDADGTVHASNMEQIVDQWRVFHDLSHRAPQHEHIDGHVRRVWRDSAGREAIEAYTIAGMGHGTPLMTGGQDGLGSSGPFMLEAGISSTLRIAQFWSIAGTVASPGPSAGEAARIAAPVAGDGSASGRPAAGTLAANHKPSSDVERIINDALKAAGLIR